MMYGSHAEWGTRQADAATRAALVADYRRHLARARDAARGLRFAAMHTHRQALDEFAAWCAKQLLLPSDATMPIPGPESGPGAPQPPNPASLDPHTSDRGSAGPSWDRPEVVTVIDREGNLWVRFEEQDCWVDLLENYCTAAEIEEMYAPCTVHSILADDDGARA